MRCRGCDYELWNMKPGTCPECGRPWTFDDFRFFPRMAQFLCPHCEHAYAGTDERGLPVPRAFICAGCQNPIDLAQMRALPVPGSDGNLAMGDEHAWSERARLGRWRAFWRMVGQSMFSPSRTGSSLPHEPRFWSAVLFSILCASLGIVICAFPFVILIGFGSGQLSSGWQYALELVASFGAFALGVALAGQLGFLLWGAVTHAILCLTGEVRRPLRHTLCATLYCSGAFAISAVPCCGIYVCVISVVWMAVSMISAIAVLQKSSIARTALAVLVPPAVAILLLAASIVWAVSSAKPFIPPVFKPVPIVAPAQDASPATSTDDETPAQENERSQAGNRPSPDTRESP